jgi:copper chaperone NosL
MKKKLTKLSRILLLLAAIALIFVLFTPIWRIDLDAPQYPEGLRLQIHATGLQGNVDIVNGLNHYIGMKTLHNEDFIEFKVLPYCIIFFVVLFAVAAFVGLTRLMNISFCCSWHLVSLRYTTSGVGSTITGIISTPTPLL